MPNFIKSNLLKNVMLTPISNVTIHAYPNTMSPSFVTINMINEGDIDPLQNIT